MDSYFFFYVFYFQISKQISAESHNFENKKRTNNHDKTILRTYLEKNHLRSGDGEREGVQRKQYPEFSKATNTVLKVVKTELSRINPLSYSWIIINVHVWQDKFPKWKSNDQRLRLLV